MVKNFYFYIYYKCYKFQMAVSPDNVPLFTSLLSLSVLQFFMLIDIMYLLSKVVDESVDNSINRENFLLAIVMGFVLLGINYLAIMYKEKYKLYFLKFEKESELQRKLRNTLVILLIILSVCGVPLQDYILF